MILNEFPDINWLKRQIKENFRNKKRWDNQPLPDEGWPTAILNVKTRQAQRKDIIGPFSLFLNVAGWSTVQVGGKDLSINENAFVVTNPGERYDLLIKDRAETLNIHFGEKFFEQALHSLQTKEEILMEDPEDVAYNLHIPFHTFFRTSSFNRQIQKIMATYHSHNNDQREEALLDLLILVLRQNRDQMKSFGLPSARKASTRAELQKRIVTALDYIHVHYADAVTLDQLAQVCCLSKFHFLRVFKEVFGLSPYQFIKQLRVQKALELIRETHLPLRHIALQVGMGEGSALSKLIYRQTGNYPSGIRKGRIN